MKCHYSIPYHEKNNTNQFEQYKTSIKLISEDNYTNITDLAEIILRCATQIQNSKNRAPSITKPEHVKNIQNSSHSGVTKTYR